MNEHVRSPWWRSWTGLSILGAGALAALYLSLVHVDHVLKALPVLIILACPLLHLFMHRGHGKGNHRSGSDDARRPRTD